MAAGASSRIAKRPGIGRDVRERLFCWIAISGLAVLGCASGNLEPSPIQGAGFESTHEEQERGRAAEKYHQAIVEAALVLEDPDLEAYLQARLDELLVEVGMEPGSVRVAVIRNPYMNAAMLANGVMHLHTGILSRIENEAQLMTLLGHELAHYHLRHGLKEIVYRDRERNKVLWSRVALSVLLLPTGFSALVFAGIEGDGLEAILAPQMAGYSRDLETEADRFGFRLMVESGYDPKESSRFFELLIRDDEALREEINPEYGHTRKDPYYYASHPDLVDRLALYDSLRRALGESCDLEVEGRVPGNDKGVALSGCGSIGSKVGEAQYMARVATAVIAGAEDSLRIGRRLGAIRMLERLVLFQPDSAEAWALLGEIRSARGTRKGELPRAVSELEEAVRLDPTLANAHRELGFLYRSLGRTREANASFERYLSVSPEAGDRLIVERLLGER